MLHAYDLVCLLVLSLLLTSGFAGPAYGYVDPSVMTYTIQALAGVAVALSALAGVAFRRGRKALMRLLDIDEFAKREVEPDVHPTGMLGSWEGQAAVMSLPEEAKAPDFEDSDSGSDCRHAAAFNDAPALDARAKGEGMDEACEPDAGEGAVSSAKRGFLDRRGLRPGWKERLAFGALAAFFFTYTVYFVAPLEIVAGSSNSLVYGPGDVWWVLVPSGLGIAAAITAVLARVRGRAFTVLLGVVFALGFCAYVQALFMNGGLPAANGAAIYWGDYLFMQVVSLAVWIAVIAAVMLYGLHNGRRMRGVVALVSGALVIVQTVGLASLAIDAAGEGSAPAEGQVVMTEDQLYTVNPDHNVVVFVLDTYDTAYLRRVLKMNPDLLEDLTGFTNYENATSAMIPTRFAIPEMMTGEMPSFDEPFSTYVAERYERGDFLEQVHDANYSIGLYTDSLRISALPEDQQRAVTGKTVNMHPLPDSMMDFGGTLYSLYTMGQYRDVPWAFKWAFWYYTDQINESMVVYSEDAPADETIYVMDDVRYYERLKGIGLTLEDGGYDGAFRFIHLLGSHYPFNYDEEANFIGEDASDVFRQSQGAIHIVSEYVNQLKELGVYENTTIIITADHGYWTITLDPIEETSTPIMFVKGEQSPEADAEPIVVDEKPVSHLDLQATVLDAMGLSWSKYADRQEWAGYSMFSDIDPDRVRYYLTTDSEPDLTEVQFREYEIDGNALEWRNWRETGRTIDAQM